MDVLNAGAHSKCDRSHQSCVVLKIKFVDSLLLQPAHEVVHAAGLQLLLHHLYLLRRAYDLHDYRDCIDAQHSQMTAPTKVWEDDLRCQLPAVKLGGTGGAWQDLQDVLGTHVFRRRPAILRHAAAHTWREGPRGAL